MTCLSELQALYDRARAQLPEDETSWIKKTALAKECAQTFAEFSRLLDDIKNYSDSPEDLKKIFDHLLAFLKKRDERVTCGAIGYPAQPNSIANLFCKTLAEGIYDYQQENGLLEFPDEPKNKAIYRILMSSLEITGVKCPVEGVWGKSDDLPAYGTFLLSDELLNGKPGPVIDYHLIVWLSENIYLFTHMLHSAAKAEALPKQYHNKLFLKTLNRIFTQSEQERIRAFNAVGKTFFQDQDDAFFLTIDNSTPHEQITVLIAALRRGGAGGGFGGSHDNASAPAMEALPFFFDYWDRLPNKFRTELEACLDNSYYIPKTLKHILGILRNPKGLWADTTCVEANANRLQGVLDKLANKTLFKTKPTQVGIQCDFYLMSKLPEGLDRKKHCYVFVQNQDKPPALYFINILGKHKIVPIADMAKFQVELNTIFTPGVVYKHLDGEEADRLIMSNGGHSVKKELPASYELALATTQGQDKLSGYPQEIFKAICEEVADLNSCVQLIDMCTDAEIESGNLNILWDKFVSLLMREPIDKRSAIFFNKFYELPFIRRSGIYLRLKEELPVWLQEEKIIEILRLLMPADIKDACEQFIAYFNKTIRTVNEFNTLLEKLTTQKQCSAACIGLKTIVQRIIMNSIHFQTLLKLRTVEECRVICNILQEVGIVAKIMTTTLHFKQILDAIELDKREVIYVPLLNILIENKTIKTASDLATVLEPLTDVQCEDLDQSGTMRRIINNDTDFTLIMLRIQSMSKRAVIVKAMKGQWQQVIINDEKNPLVRFANILLHLTEEQRITVYDEIKSKLLEKITSPQLFTVSEMDNVLWHLNREQQAQVQAKYREKYNQLNLSQKRSLIKMHDQFKTIQKFISADDLIVLIKTRFMPIYAALGAAGWTQTSTIDMLTFQDMIEIEKLWQETKQYPLGRAAIALQLTLGREELNDPELVNTVDAQARKHTTFGSTLLHSFNQTNRDHSNRLEKIRTTLSPTPISLLLNSEHSL